MVATDTPPLLLSGVWTTQNPAGWWMSEKLDGVRAYWDGERLLSRNGNPVSAPAWFLAQMPAGTALDGELWMGRRAYLAMLACFKRRVPLADEWRQVKFMVFDLPHHTGTFEERQEALRDGTFSLNLGVVPHERCKDRWHLRRALREVNRRGGEGLMLRQPGSFYTIGRSHTLLKVRCANNAEML